MKIEKVIGGKLNKGGVYIFDKNMHFSLFIKIKENNNSNSSIEFSKKGIQPSWFYPNANYNLHKIFYKWHYKTNGNEQ